MTRIVGSETTVTYKSLCRSESAIAFARPNLSHHSDPADWESGKRGTSRNGLLVQDRTTSLALANEVRLYMTCWTTNVERTAGGEADASMAVDTPTGSETDRQQAHDVP